MSTLKSKSTRCSRSVKGKKKLISRRLAGSQSWLNGNFSILVAPMTSSNHNKSGTNSSQRGRIRRLISKQLPMPTAVKKWSKTRSKQSRESTRYGKSSALKTNRKRTQRKPKNTNRKRRKHSWHGSFWTVACEPCAMNKLFRTLPSARKRTSLPRSRKVITLHSNSWKTGGKVAYSSKSSLMCSTAEAVSNYSSSNINSPNCRRIIKQLPSMKTKWPNYLLKSSQLRVVSSNLSCSRLRIKLTSASPTRRAISTAMWTGHSSRRIEKDLLLPSTRRRVLSSLGCQDSRTQHLIGLQLDWLRARRCRW